MRRMCPATHTHQVRKTKWAQRPLGDLEVPGAIIRVFSGTSTSFSRMWNTGARIYRAWIWEKLHRREPPRLEFSPAEVLVQLEPYDLEDLIYTWMQVSIWRCRRRAHRHACLRVDNASSRNLLTRERPSEVRFVSNVGADLLNATESALGEVA